MADTKVLSFRLDERHHEMLCKRAREVGQSAGEFARQLVLEGLLGAQLTAAIEAPIQEGLREKRGLHARVSGLQEDLVTGLKALLVTAGKVPAREVEAWVEANLGGDHHA